jgi:hypothetical protein
VSSAEDSTVASALLTPMPGECMHLKVYDGTRPSGGSSLCATCRHATIIRGQRIDDEIVQCTGAGLRATRITFKVTSCSAYHDDRLPSYMDLFDQAWILQPGSKSKSAGFVRGRDLHDDELMREIRLGRHHHDDDDAP